MTTNNMELLNIEYDTESIDLSWHGLFGILDLKKFKKLKKLTCTHNFITKIINFPLTLIILDCSGNRISSLDNLPYSLIDLNCSYNCIKSFENLPISLLKLNFIDNRTNKRELSIREYLRSSDEYIFRKLTNLPLSLDINTIKLTTGEIKIVFMDVLKNNNNDELSHFCRSKKIRKII